MKPERHVVEADFGRVDAIADYVSNEEHDDVGREVVGTVVVERLSARIAMVGHFQKAAEKPALAARRAAAHESLLHSLWNRCGVRRGNGYSSSGVHAGSF